MMAGAGDRAAHTRAGDRPQTAEVRRGRRHRFNLTRFSSSSPLDHGPKTVRCPTQKIWGGIDGPYANNIVPEDLGDARSRSGSDSSSATGQREGAGPGAPPARGRRVWTHRRRPRRRACVASASSAAVLAAQGCRSSCSWIASARSSNVAASASRRRPGQQPLDANDRTVHPGAAEDDEPVLFAGQHRFQRLAALTSPSAIAVSASQASVINQYWLRGTALNFASASGR